VIAPEIVGVIAIYAAANELAAIIAERRAHDPPSSDFRQVVHPTIPNVSAPQLKTDIARPLGRWFSATTGSLHI